MRFNAMTTLIIFFTKHPDMFPEPLRFFPRIFSSNVSDTLNAVLLFSAVVIFLCLSENKIGEEFFFGRKNKSFGFFSGKKF